jgi:type IV secretion system protein VirB1
VVLVKEYAAWSVALADNEPSRFLVGDRCIMLPGLEQLHCQGMVVPMEVMQHVVHVESSYNPFAIGVVGGHLVRQPKNLPEAIATVKMLETRGYNFSIGLAQVNRYNLAKYGLDSYEKAFQECPNLQAGSKILADCYKQHNGDWGKSFSCYYSGNSVTGFRHGYVQKIYASMRQDMPIVASQSFVPPIEVVSKPSRRVVGVTRYPVSFTAASRVLQQPTSRLQRRIASANQSEISAASVSTTTAPISVPVSAQPLPSLAYSQQQAEEPVQVKAVQAKVPVAAVPNVDPAFVF